MPRPITGLGHNRTNPREQARAFRDETMAKKIAVIAIHGMGDTNKKYADPLKENLESMLKPAEWAEIHFDKIFYQDILQNNQKKLFDRSKSQLDSKFLRKFLLYGISDAAGLEYSRTIAGGVYDESQQRIFNVMGKAFEALGQQLAPVVMVAQSLGGQVISNYIWDAHKKSVSWGVWRHQHDLSPDDKKFRRFETLRTLFTTGCNIPIFVGGLPRKKIVPISRPNPNFQWRNYFDEDDVLGWPLKPLSVDYKKLVTDVPINAGRFWESWNPLSHTQYWTDRDFLKPLTAHLRKLLR